MCLCKLFVCEIYFILAFHRHTMVVKVDTMVLNVNTMVELKQLFPCCFQRSHYVYRIGIKIQWKEEETCGRQKMDIKIHEIPRVKVAALKGTVCWGAFCKQQILNQEITGPITLSENSATDDQGGK